MNYFKVWWSDIPVEQKFNNRKEADRYIRKMKIDKWEIVEFNNDLEVVNKWTN